MPRAEREPPVAADEIDELAQRLERLSISRRDPHAFFEERSEIVHGMRKIADDMRSARATN